MPHRTDPANLAPLTSYVRWPLHSVYACAARDLFTAADVRTVHDTLTDGNHLLVNRRAVLRWRTDPAFSISARFLQQLCATRQWHLRIRSPVLFPSEENERYLAYCSKRRRPPATAPGFHGTIKALREAATDRTWRAIPSEWRMARSTFYRWKAGEPVALTVDQLDALASAVYACVCIVADGRE